jgi:hypothetical protein
MVISAIIPTHLLVFLLLHGRRFFFFYMIVLLHDITVNAVKTLKRQLVIKKLAAQSYKSRDGSSLVAGGLEPPTPCSP